MDINTTNAKDNLAVNIYSENPAAVSKKKSPSRIKGSTGERIFDILNVSFMIILSFITIYPFWYVLVVSLSNGNDLANGPVWFWPRNFTLNNYIYVLQYKLLRSAFVVTIARCLAGPVISVGVCMLAAYPLSKRWLPKRKWFLFFYMLPMFIGGTVISNYVVMAKLKLLNNFLVYIIPGAFGFFNMVIMRTFIEQIPIELEESAMLDGANYWVIFTKIILPQSKPIMAAFAFFSVVHNWLDFTTTLLYVTKQSLYTLQYVLYLVVNASQASNMIDITNIGESMRRLKENQRAALPTPEVVKMTVMVVVTFPLLFVYPFFQKYFVVGMNLGAIKG